MKDVIAAGVPVKVIAELGEGRGTEEVNVGGEVVPGDQLDERAGYGSVADIPVAIGAGYDKEDVNAVGRKVGGGGRSILYFVEAALDLAGVGESRAQLGVAEGFPWPGERGGIAAGDLEGQAAVVAGGGGMEECACAEIAKER
jgi:hypothetical protein